MRGIFILLVALAIIGYFVWPRHKLGLGRSYEKELLRRCLGDEEKAERLMRLEYARRPGISREQAAKAALQSLARDGS